MGRPPIGGADRCLELMNRERRPPSRRLECGLAKAMARLFHCRGRATLGLWGVRQHAIAAINVVQGATKPIEASGENGSNAFRGRQRTPSGGNAAVTL